MAHCFVTLDASTTTMTVYNSYNIATVSQWGSGVWKLTLIKPVRDRFKAAILCGVTTGIQQGFQNGVRISHASFYRSNYEIFVTVVQSNSNVYLSSGSLSIAVYEE